MAYASRAGRARTSSISPQAHGICDRCGFRYNFIDLKWQYDWRGATLQNLRILVCDTCYDTPQEQLRSIILPPDPVPIINARPENYQADETDYASLTPSTTDPITGLPIPNTTDMATVTGLNMTHQPVGKPVGLPAAAQAPLVEAQAWNVLLPVLSISSLGTTVQQVTCSSPHGLQTNAQVNISGVTNKGAAGTYSITVTTATAFTYTTNSVIPAGSLLTGTTRVVTMDAGLPYNYSQVPLTGA